MMDVREQLQQPIIRPVIPPDPNIVSGIRQRKDNSECCRQRSQSSLCSRRIRRRSDLTYPIYFPTRCSTSLLFSWQMYSISSLRSNDGCVVIVHGFGVVFVRGTPGGRQRASGSSLLRFSLRFL